MKLILIFTNKLNDAKLKNKSNKLRFTLLNLKNLFCLSSSTSLSRWSNTLSGWRVYTAFQELQLHPHQFPWFTYHQRYIAIFMPPHRKLGAYGSCPVCSQELRYTKDLMEIINPHIITKTNKSGYSIAKCTRFT